MNRRQFSRLGLMSGMAVAAGGGAIGATSHEPGSSVETLRQEGAFSPTILSIRDHVAPEWFDDAKFGMFIDYGLYSVAGYAPKREQGAMYPDWYLYNMYHDAEVVEYHKKTWGAGFQRDDFIPKFTAENFDPEALAKIADEAGMRYVVPFCKHHDGFCLWPSSYTKRNVMDMGPHRDLIGPLNAACKKRNLKFGFYFSLEEWEYPILKDGKKMVRLWNASKVPPHEIVPFGENAMAGKITGKIPVSDFFGEYIVPQAKEFIDKYDPDLLWFDGEWATPIEETRSPEIVSYFYNKAAGHKEVASNDRLGECTRFNVGDFYSSEYGTQMNIQKQLVHKWEDCRGVSQSFGYNWQDTEKNIITVTDLIDKLVGIVSEGGNLLLIVNLDGRGALPEYIRTRLVDIGMWLKVNGEAIYATRPWTVANQGDVLRFTQSKNGRFLYAIHRGWPQGEVSIDDLFLDVTAKIQMLGTRRDLDWRQIAVKAGYGQAGRVVIDIPQDLKDAIGYPNAVTFKIQLAD
jgi:alpha-L-fucosidase